MKKINGIGSFIIEHLLALTLTGFIFAALFAAYTVYNNYYDSAVMVSLVYPGIEKGEYPNGERFMMYDFINGDRIEEALEAMRAKGWYTNITADDIKKNLYIGVHLEEPVQSKVTQEILGGINYTYYSNEYYISFRQSLDIRLSDAPSLFGLLDADLSDKFLNELLLANFKYFIANYQKNSDEYENLARTDGINTDNYDYTDIADLYSSKISSCLDYLYYIQSDGEKAFVSESTGLSFPDLIVSYETLLNVKVKDLASYSKTARITNQPDQYLNRTAVTIERYYYYMLKKSKESDIAGNAMDIYDHTYTKQIVIVGANDKDGLYQAHPKTGYDTVTQQSLAASVEAASYDEQISKIKTERSEYMAAYGAKAAYAAGLNTLNAMVGSIKAEYDSLLTKTLGTITDYSREYNSDYIHTIDSETSLFGASDIIKTCAVFVFFFAFAAVMVYAGSTAKKAMKGDMENSPASVEFSERFGDSGDDVIYPDTASAAAADLIRRMEILENEFRSKDTEAGVTSDRGGKGGGKDI